MKGFETHHRFIDFLDETVVLFDHVIQIFNLEYFNKTDQSCQHQQNVNILQPGIVGPAFMQDDFVWKTIAIDRLFKECGGCHFVAMFRLIKSTVSLNLSTVRYK